MIQNVPITSVRDLSTPADLDYDMRMWSVSCQYAQGEKKTQVSIPEEKPTNAKRLIPLGYCFVFVSVFLLNIF